MAGVPIYRKHLQLVEAADFRPTDGRKRTIERAFHGLTLIACETVATDVPEAHRGWYYDLRRGRLSIVGGLLRFIDFLHRRGFPMETALLIPEWIRAYILERYGHTPTPMSMPLELVETGEHRRAA